MVSEEISEGPILMLMLIEEVVVVSDSIQVEAAIFLKAFLISCCSFFSAFKNFKFSFNPCRFIFFCFIIASLIIFHKFFPVSPPPFWEEGRLKPRKACGGKVHPRVGGRKSS